MVIRGGENIYPREVEEFLHTHPDVLDAQVIGVPDSRYGEELCAWVRMRDGAPPLTAEALREYAAAARALQDPALRARRRRVPDDGDRQGAQGRDARGHRRRARSLRASDRAPRTPAGRDRLSSPAAGPQSRPAE